MYTHTHTHTHTAPPQFIQNNNNTAAVEIRQGGPIELDCSAVGAPEPNYTWTVPPGSNRLAVTGPILRIPFTNAGDMGMYRCNASNKLGAVQRTFNVNVYSKSAQLHFVKLHTTCGSACFLFSFTLGSADPLASFPGLPRFFCSAVCVQYNTRKQKSAKCSESFPIFRTLPLPCIILTANRIKNKKKKTGAAGNKTSSQDRQALPFLEPVLLNFIRVLLVFIADLPASFPLTAASRIKACSM